MMLAKVSRICVRDISSSAFGTTDSTNADPSASISVISGATTVVFPAPMIICLTFDPPHRTMSTNLWTMSICFWRSRMFHTNSNMRKRGSNVISPCPRASAKCLRPASIPAKSSQAWMTFGTSVSPLPGSAIDWRRSLRTVTAAPMHRFTWPRRLALSIVRQTSWRIIAARSALMYGLSPSTSFTPAVDKTAPKRNSGHASAACPAVLRRINSVRSRRP
mmetsp:Transcript_47132/g.111093  ORF Transcript_47132/g.111093 Transcript_47132/m.111093 type:complete len:219 (+) Transcript_47132:1483-2139(+)